VDDSGALAYAQFRHGPDGAILLDPFFTAHIKDHCEGKEVVDAGCGAAPWAIYAAHVGARAIFAFDSSEQMVTRGESEIAQQAEEIQERITLELADVLDIPRPAQSFDTALSINVGCALPSLGAWNIFSQPVRQPLQMHFQEMARVLKPGGIAVVTAPASLEVPFTTYGDEDGKVTSLEADLAAATSEGELKEIATAHEGVLRATMVNDSGRWQLIRNGAALLLGQPIQRKIPGLVVPNFAHSQDEYLEVIDVAGFEVLDLASPTLPVDDYTPETGLGVQYVDHNAFDIFLLENQSAPAS